MNIMRKFRRDKDHKKSLFINLAKSLIKHKSITITHTKAKSLSSFVEKIVTKARKNDLHTKRVLMSKLMNDNVVVDKIFEEIVPMVGDRKGGYLRVVGSHINDSGVKYSIIQFVDM